MAKCPLAVIHPGPSDVEVRVSYPLAAFATHKKRGRDGKRREPAGPNTPRKNRPSSKKEEGVSYPLAAVDTHEKAGAPNHWSPGPGDITAGSSVREECPPLYQLQYPQQYDDQYDHYQHTDRSFHGYVGRSAEHSSTPSRSPAAEKAPHHTPPLSRAFPR